MREWNPNNGRWHPANHGAGKRLWFVFGLHPLRHYRNTKGTLVRFVSYESAQQKADELNERDGLETT